MKMIFDDTCEQDLMAKSSKEHIIQVTSFLPTMPRTVNEEKPRDMPKEFYELRDWLGIYRAVWEGEIKEKNDE